MEIILWIISIPCGAILLLIIWGYLRVQRQYFKAWLLMKKFQYQYRKDPETAKVMKESAKEILSAMKNEKLIDTED